MNYLGIDYGSKRLGVAVSDPLFLMGIPLCVLDNDTDVLSQIKKICIEKKVSDIVVGESKDFSQQDNEIMKEVYPFVEQLKNEIGVNVHLHPEFMTSIEAERLQGSNKMNDASAASIILTDYLGKIKNKEQNVEE